MKKVFIISDRQEIFSLWRENKVSQEWRSTVEAFEVGFFNWLEKQDKERMAYYGSRNAVVEFVGNPDGLNSVVEMPMYDALAEWIKDLFWNVVEPKNKSHETEEQKES